jgi:tetratricopeptide (TPR) repeat protein
MSRKRDSRSGGTSGNRRSVSIMGASFAIAMAFFLVIGMIAIAVPEFLGGGNDDTPELPTFEEDGESEEDRLRAQLEEDPDDIDTRVQLADLLANTGRYNEAIREYERAVDQRPDDASLRLAFATVLERRGFDLDAEVQLKRALELQPDNVDAMFQLAEVMRRDNPPRTEEAESLYREIIEIAPESFYAQLAEERLAEHDDQPDDAADDASEEE